MSLFIVFIVGAVLMGAGAMLSPAWRTAQPRVALAATLCLALVVGGAVFYAEAFAWNTLVVDYLLFVLLSGVVLGGTLSTAQARAEAKGEQLADRDQGWPGPQDLAFFAVVALLVLIPLVHLPAALGTGGQVLGFHTLSARFGETFNSLAPFDSQARVIISPGFHALSAYLSQQLSQPIPLIQLCLAAVCVYLSIWLAYDFGAELRDKRLGRLPVDCGFALRWNPPQPVGRAFRRTHGLAFFASLLALCDALSAGIQPRRFDRGRSNDGRRLLHELDNEPHHVACVHPFVPADLATCK